MKGNNIYHQTKIGLALAPQSISGTTAAGATIAEPWNFGRQIRFIVLGGAFAATVDATLVVQGRRRDTGNWEALKERDGVTDLAFTPTLLDDAGGLENAVASGSIPFDEIDSGTYNAIRLFADENGSAAMLIAAAYEIFDLHETPSGDTDDLFGKLITSTVDIP